MPNANAALVAYELKTTIIGIQPPIRRRLQVPNTMLLCCLHDALQAAFGWTDSRLHQFEKNGKLWSVPEWYEDADDIAVVLHHHRHPDEQGPIYTKRIEALEVLMKGMT